MKVRKFIKKNAEGYLYVMPLIIGLLLFTFYPMICALKYSFMDVDLINPPNNFGLQNYKAIFDGSNVSKLFWLSLKNTIVYTVIEVSLSMVLSYLLAYLVVKDTRTNRFFRIVYYLPVLIPGVVAGLLWGNILNKDYGLINSFLINLFGTSFDFLKSEHSMMTFIVVQLFTIGGGMIIWISAFKSIPGVYYEAARMDGASAMHRFLHITLPLSTPYIFYNLVMGIIGALQMFAAPYVLTGGTGGDGNSLLFYVMYIYQVGFSELNFGQASALSWVLFVIIAILTFIVFKTSKWVFYGGEE